jgi:hypothetical protein
VEAMLRDGGEMALAAYWKEIPGYQRDVAADLGSRVHLIAELLARKELVTVEPAEVPYIAQYRAWLDAVRPRIRQVEFMVYSHEWKYGGTADALMDIKHETWLIDYKTGSGIYPEVALQLAGLGYADWVGKPGDGRMYRMPLIDHYGALHIRPDGCELVELDVGAEEWAAFKALRIMREWLDTRARKVRKE